MVLSAFKYYSGKGAAMTEYISVIAPFFAIHFNIGQFSLLRFCALRGVLYNIFHIIEEVLFLCYNNTIKLIF